MIKFWPISKINQAQLLGWTRVEIKSLAGFVSIRFPKKVKTMPSAPLHSNKWIIWSRTWIAHRTWCGWSPYRKI